MNVKVVGVMRNAQKNFASKSPANEVGLSWKLRRLSCCCSDYSRGLLLELHSIAIIIVIVERDLVSLASSETTTASLAVGRRVSHLPSDFHGGELDSIVSSAHLKCLRRRRRARAREEYTSLASSAHPRRRRRASYALSLVRGIRALNRHVDPRSTLFGEEEMEWTSSSSPNPLLAGRTAGGGLGAASGQHGKRRRSLQP
eukprot:tig00021096_g18126.t1